MIVQIETMAALEQLPAIAAVPGVDSLFIGPADLAASMGHLGDFNHPDVQAKIKHGVELARKAGKPIGTVGPNAGDGRPLSRVRVHLDRDQLRHRHDGGPRNGMARQGEELPAPKP